MAPASMASPPTGVDDGRSALQFCARPRAEYKVIISIFGGLFVLHLVAIEEAAFTSRQFLAFDRFFKRIDIARLALEFATVEVPLDL